MQPSVAILIDDFELMGLETFELTGVIVEKRTVVEAFRLFTTYFHPHLPILGPVSLKTIYHSQTFLFWTILIIIAQRSPVIPDENLFIRLHEPYVQMLRSEALRAPAPLSKIQALLFLCLWPLPVTNQREDPSWLYCGIAINAALYMSLHRSSPRAGATPSFYSLGVISGSTHERTNTWLGCFYVSTSLSMHLGLPPMINTSSDLTNIRTILAEHYIPREFSLQIRMLLTLAGFTNVLSHNSNDSVVDSSVTQLLDGELDALKIMYPDGWTSMTDFSMTVVKMHVYTLVITRSRSGTGSKEILLKLGLAAALRVIHLANLRFHERLPDKAQQQQHQQQQALLTITERERTLPKDYFRGLAFATIFLLRYFSLNNCANAEEQQLAANHVIMAHTIFKTLATQPMDEYGRVARLFETLCKQQAQMPPSSAGGDDAASGKPAHSDRMGVSIVLDAINTARALRGHSMEIHEHEVLGTAAATTTTPGSLPGHAQQQQQQQQSNGSSNNANNSNNSNGVPDVYGSGITPQIVEPWPSDLAFANVFWGDPSWDVFSLPADPQFQPGPGLG